MKTLIINYLYTQQTLHFGDHEKADIAYGAIKQALAEHREFRNDEGKRTVSFDHDGADTTVVIAAISSVGLQDEDYDNGHETMTRHLFALAAKRKAWAKEYKPKED